MRRPDALLATALTVGLLANGCGKSNSPGSSEKKTTTNSSAAVAELRSFDPVSRVVRLGFGKIVYSHGIEVARYDPEDLTTPEELEFCEDPQVVGICGLVRYCEQNGDLKQVFVRQRIRPVRGSDGQTIRRAELMVNQTRIDAKDDKLCDDTTIDEADKNKITPKPPLILTPYGTTNS